MKTLREVILGRHEAAEPKLDAIREQVIASLTRGANANAPASSRGSRGGRQPTGWALAAGWRQLLWSMRWHLAGMGAAWFVAALLSVDQRPGPALRVIQRDTLSPQQSLATLRDKQRQLRELIEAPAPDETTAPPEFTPTPHSQRQTLSTATA